MTTRRVADAVDEAARRLEKAGVAFGHGTTTALQEAMWLAAHSLDMTWDELLEAMESPMPAARETPLRKLVLRRISTRKPAAYLINEAWLGPHRFYVDERVIVPRSFIAELLLKPGTDSKLGQPADGPSRVLDLCTGSGCLAILAALNWPDAKIDAGDVSEDALAVARRNVTDYKLGRRVRLVKSDLFSGLAGRRYGLIVSNPPYVKAASMRKLPPEFQREPKMALASGADGLDHTRAILAQAKQHLEPGGVLVVEIGHNRKALEKSYPRLRFRWPRTSSGPGYVFTLKREELP